MSRAGGASVGLRVKQRGRSSLLMLRCSLPRALAYATGGSVILTATKMLAQSEESPKSKALFKFGVIADVQWADIEDGYNYARTTKRCYRGALKVLRDAVAWWEPRQLDFVAQLGDLIDGQNSKLGASVSAMAAATSLLAKMSCRIVNIVGNVSPTGSNRCLSANLSAPDGRRFDPATRSTSFTILIARRWPTIWTLAPDGVAIPPPHDASSSALRRPRDGA